MWKKYIFTFLLFILSILWFQNTYSNCEYTTEIQTCYQANQDNTTRAVQDFVCLADKWNPQFYTYQIILDKRFQEIDTKIEEYITDLEENKWYYFGENQQENFVDGVKNITNIFKPSGEFWQEYEKICNQLAQQVLACQNDPSIKDIYPNRNDTINISTMTQYLADSSTNCSKLAQQKLDIYKQVSFDILYLNKTAIWVDSLKTYQQTQRSKYDKLLSKLMLNIEYVNHIWAKWPAKIKNTK